MGCSACLHDTAPARGATLIAVAPTVKAAYSAAITAQGEGGGCDGGWKNIMAEATLSDAIAWLLRHGILYTDVRAPNVVVRRDGAGRITVVVLVDYDDAKLLPGSTVVTHKGAQGVLDKPPSDIALQSLMTWLNSLRDAVVARFPFAVAAPARAPAKVLAESVSDDEQPTCLICDNVICGSGCRSSSARRLLCRRRRQRARVRNRQ